MPDSVEKEEYKRPTYAAIRAKMMDMSREPFSDALALLMCCTPDKEILENFANDHPDRWANTVRAFAQLAGFHDKLDIDANLMVTIQQMGDAQLIEAIEQAMPMILEHKEKAKEVVDAS